MHTEEGLMQFFEDQVNAMLAEVTPAHQASDAPRLVLRQRK